jgi:hypothetical protein
MKKIDSGDVTHNARRLHIALFLENCNKDLRAKGFSKIQNQEPK